MNFFKPPNRKREISELSEEDLRCKECHQKKDIVWDCGWEPAHKVCNSCATKCCKCRKMYCGSCRFVLVFCDSCDAMFCPDCKPKVCVCIVPRALTCFLISFKSKQRDDGEVVKCTETTETKKKSRKTSDQTESTKATTAAESVSVQSESLQTHQEEEP